MKAMVLREPSPSFEFSVHRVEKPTPGPGQVLVRVLGSSVNPVDAKIADGTLAPLAPPPPSVLGTDVSGVIEETGPAVEDLRVGDRVFGVAGGVGSLAGAWSEYQCCDTRLLARAPTTIAIEEAAALALVGITASEAMAHIKPASGMRLLVQGGAGGVGHIAVQLAAIAGADVVATAKGADGAFVESLGASRVIAYDAPEADRLVEDAAEGGFDAVFDTVGGDVLDRSLGLVKPYGTLVTTLALSTHDLTPAHARALSFHVVYMLLPMLERAGMERNRPILETLAAAIDRGSLRLHTPKHFGFTHITDAVRTLLEGGVGGKVALHNDLGKGRQGRRDLQNRTGP